MEKQLSKILKPYEESELVTSWKYDTNTSTLTMKVDTCEEEFTTTIFIPLEKGSYKFTIKKSSGTQVTTSEHKDVQTALVPLLDEFDKQRNDFIDKYGGDTPITPITPGTVFTPSYPQDEIVYISDDDGDLIDDEEYYVNKKIFKIFKEEKNKLKSKTDWFVDYDSSGETICKVHVLFPPKKALGIATIVANAWGIDISSYIGISVSFFLHLDDQDRAPIVEAFQSGDINNPNKDKLDGKKKFGLYWTVETRIREYFLKNWWPYEKLEAQSKKGKIFIEELTNFVIQVIQNCTKYCIICNGEMPYVGIKPTVCANKLCIFGLEQYGLGVELETEIQNNSDLVDLMITLAYSASCANTQRFNPFNPFPSGLEVKTNSGTLDFLTDGKPDNTKVRKVLEKLPDVATLTKWAKDKLLKENLDSIDPLAYRLLRWILATNRSHLKRCTKNEQISQMQTPYQYFMASSPPEKESTFRSLKKKYGSFYAFHGSALFNWHAILRVGLKNMSGTPGQLNGAAYGYGIYLAADSATSFSYIRYQNGWPKSMFGGSNLGCLAMCEVINHPDLKGMPNPYYVVRNEQLVQTRYFFVYAGTSRSVNVLGKSLKPPP